MEPKEPTHEKMIKAVKSYYGLNKTQMYMLTRKQQQMVILCMLQLTI